MTDNLSIAIHPFARRILISLSVKGKNMKLKIKNNKLNVNQTFYSWYKEYFFGGGGSG